MSLRRQAYEWRNITSGTSIVSNIGHPILTYDALGQVQATARQIPANIPIDIMVGGIGNNLEMPAANRAHQFIVIDNIGSYPYQAALNIRIDTTKYFQSPDGVPTEGMPASAMPFYPSTILGNQEVVPMIEVTFRPNCLCITRSNMGYRIHHLYYPQHWRRNAYYGQYNCQSLCSLFVN